MIYINYVFFLYLCMVHKNKFGRGHFVCDNWCVKKIQLGFSI